MSLFLDGANDAARSSARYGRDALTTMNLIEARLVSDARLSDRTVVRPHPLLVTVRSDRLFAVLAPGSLWDRGREVLRPFAHKLASGEAMLVLVGSPAVSDVAGALNRGLGALCSPDPSADELYVAIHNVCELLESKARAEARGKWLNRYRYELGELIEIAKAITTERELDKLLSLILEKSRFITGADAGSIYVVEGDDPDPLRRTLRFKLSQNDSVPFDAREFTLPVSPRSMSGYVALHKRPINIADVYDLPAVSPYGFDRSFDAKIGYRTKSMLCMPLLSRKGEVIGVIQLINKKRAADRKLLSEEDVEDQVVPFDARSEELVGTLGSQAGIALENAVLYTEIHHMLEGFVRASVEAIEQRDPTTSGHSRRVALLTVGLARALERDKAGPYRGVTWTKDDLRELEYASLLHDFGKIGVREQVLVKAKKLYPHELAIIRHRIEIASRSYEVEILERKLRLVQRGARADELAALDQELSARKAELEAAYTAIVAANEPSVLKGGDFARIEAIARETFTDFSGDVVPLLRAEEVACLSVARGSLTPAEIEEIRNHVVHTYQFLSQIPWGKQFRRVAVIAGSHHERLNGTGYPHRLRAEEIPLQSKMMSVSDIFDALTASDRPYKKAVPVDRALDILGFEVKDQHVDADLVRVFIEAKVWTVLEQPGAPHSALAASSR
ncbi:HD domain-containing phosphohydrolase [Polyangium sorediatum]|uniref:HD domain-containing phosphohydrolase n=1 Tax=Polyangium sorediatum TaxID=889274 RepID=A0ABT6NHS4_9BACT|nr:HD family phosphohydrolase [Polyangium sorediatum]MDI1427853.1 HD domain-containing phosphohydrolase [Polyangium sorediatum]